MNDFSNAGAAGGLFVGMLFTILMIGLAIGLFFAICYWRIFSKAGKPGWAAIIPIYNTIVLLEIVGRPIWWIILLFIPLVNLVILLILVFDLCRSYGQGGGFAIGMIILPIIFIPMLAFGNYPYVGPGGNAIAAGPAMG